MEPEVNYTSGVQGEVYEKYDGNSEIVSRQFHGHIFTRYIRICIMLLFRRVYFSKFTAV